VIVQRLGDGRSIQAHDVVVDPGVALVEPGEDLRPRWATQRRLHVSAVERRSLVDEL
jgi:hypothetical protein